MAGLPSTESPNPNDKTDDEATQPATQYVIDPRRMGRNSSGLSASDVSDVLCILHPCSIGAFRVVARTAERSPQHVLQNTGFGSHDDRLDPGVLEEAETFILGSSNARQAHDLALRFSSRTVNPAMGFVFGRSPGICDIVLDVDTVKRVSNMHFRIFVNKLGVVMLQDISTNGTLVDETHLRGKGNTRPTTRMLTAGSMIQILSPIDDEVIKFILRIPSREGFVDEYTLKFQQYMRHVAMAEAWDDAARRGLPMPAQNNGGLDQAMAPFAGVPPARTISSIKPLLPHDSWGMKWNGGDTYNVVGHLGKGAFATVYRLATKSDGHYFAAKELEKRKFMKNGILDRKLDNEMQIMKGLRHPNIVQYIDYHDVGNHLYIIMEYVPCGDLQGYLQNNGVLPEHLAKTMARQIFKSMAYLHQKKITHRDIKPDNILIACEDPFSVKLSDFGLSKVVKNEETFLKTFCGTLLYCAPEVFPHYEAHIASKGTKRRRCSNTPQTKFHSYSQSVDIWSFAAVLWFSLCNKPPFEGVADNTGRGMFDKIMRTPLDTTPLQQLGISANAIDLLVAMLNTDPSLRPSEVQCLQHPWLADGSVPLEMEFETDLNAIPEEDEEEETEPDVSGLSIHDGVRQSEVRDSDEASFDSGDFGSGDFDYFDLRQSKRVKASPFNLQDQAAMESSPEVSYHPTPFLHRTETSLVSVSQPPQPNRLFGEIGQSAFESSGVFGARTSYALATSNRGLRDPSTSADTSARNTDEPYSTVNTNPVNDMQEQYHDQCQNIIDHPVEGAESLVRELNMESPRSANSPAAELDEPRTPRTPEPPQNPSIGQVDGGAEEQHDHSDDITPKQPVFNRQISLPLPSSFYYNTNDRNMQNLEYATKISDNDFITAPELTSSDHPSLPATMNASANPLDRSSDDTTNSPEATSKDAIESPPPSQFLRPPPRLGKLTST
ncbi:hypothetical protein B0A49_12344, partial [Cryomyces minteri]